MTGGIPNSEEAGAWLREHFKDDPAPEIDISWQPSEEEDDARYGRLLTLLFGPRADREAA